MKIICIHCNYASQTLISGSFATKAPFLTMKSDTALLRNNQAFFYPDFSSDIVAEVGLVMRIDKVGRSISEKFASRYCGAIGIGVDFTARDILSNCQAKGLPWESAKSFDFSFPLSPRMIPVEDIGDLQNIHFGLNVNGTNEQQGSSGNMILSMEKIIAEVSRTITLKVGDLFFLGTPSPAYKVAMGDRLKAFIGDEDLLDFEVR